jgi:hypothetical protein
MLIFTCYPVKFNWGVSGAIIKHDGRGDEGRRLLEIKVTLIASLILDESQYLRGCSKIKS